MLFVAAAELVIICDVTVVNNGQVADLVAAERLRMAEIDLGFGGETRVADAVRALHLRNSVFTIEVGGRTDLLHDFQASPHADDFEFLVQRFNGGGEGRDVRNFADHQPPGVSMARELVAQVEVAIENDSQRREASGAIPFFAQLNAQHHLVIDAGPKKGDSGGVRSATG